MYASHTYFYTQEKFSVLLNVISSVANYLNPIDSNCDVDESCPRFFIGTVLATGPECIINIYVILGRRNLFEVHGCCVDLAARNFGNGRVVLCTWETIIASSGLQLLSESCKAGCSCFVCILYNIITIQCNYIL